MINTDNAVIHSIKCDLQQLAVRHRIDVVQGDVGSRMLELSLCSGGVAWTPPNGTVVLVTYGRANGTGGIYDTMADGTAAGSIDGSNVLVQLAPEMTAVPGDVYAAVRLIHQSSEAVISTFAFCIWVDPDPALNTADDTGNYINWFGAGALTVTVTQADNGTYTADVPFTQLYTAVKNGRSVVARVGATYTYPVYVAEAGILFESRITPLDKTTSISIQDDDKVYVNYLSEPTAVEMSAVKADNTVSVTATYDDGSSSETVIALDESGDPVSVTKNGTVCSLTWEGFDE